MPRHLAAHPTRSLGRLPKRLPLLGRGPFVLSLFLMTALLAHPTAAADPPWNGWRGPARDGSFALVADGLTSRPETLWSLEVGNGHASPISDGEHVFIFTREGESERLRAVRLADGEVVWQSELATEKPSIGLGGRSHGRGPKATPLLTAAHAGAANPAVVTWGMTGVLTAHEAATGEIRWRTTLTAFDEATPHFGVSASPVQIADQLVVSAGSTKDGAVVALDLATGEPVWQTDVAVGYSSPVLARVDGQEQIVLLASDQVIGLDGESGDQLWSHPFVGKGFAQDIATPLVLELGGRPTIVISGDKRSTLQLIPERAEDGSWTVTEGWRNDDLTVDMSSPVALGGRLFLHAQQKKGQLTALDAATGRALWTSPPRWGAHASLVALDDTVLALRDDATVQLWAPGDAGDGAWTLQGEAEVADSPTWAHPLVLSDGSVVIKDETHIRRLRLLRTSD